MLVVIYPAHTASQHWSLLGGWLWGRVPHIVQQHLQQLLSHLAHLYQQAAGGSGQLHESYLQEGKTRVRGIK